MGRREGNISCPQFAYGSTFFQRSDLIGRNNLDCNVMLSKVVVKLCTFRAGSFLPCTVSCPVILRKKHWYGTVTCSHLVANDTFVYYRVRLVVRIVGVGGLLCGVCRGEAKM